MKRKSSALSAVLAPRRLIAILISVAGLSLGLFAFAATVAPTAIFTVTNNHDSGAGSLRDAILAANANPGADTIIFNLSGAITLSSTLPAVTDELTIDGTGQSIAISGNNSVRVMSVDTGKSLTVINLTITKGACGQGCGIDNAGTLNVIKCTLSNNSANPDAGGIYNRAGATLNLIDSTLSDNTAASTGAGIRIEGGVVTIARSATAPGRTVAASARRARI